jgi:hypothetical protein
VPIQSTDLAAVYPGSAHSAIMQLAPGIDCPSHPAIAAFAVQTPALSRGLCCGPSLRIQHALNLPSGALRSQRWTDAAMRPAGFFPGSLRPQLGQTRSITGSTSPPPSSKYV